MTAPWISDRILVTGSGGRLGSEIRRLFGARATAADLPELDLTDRESVRRVVSRCRPRLVINTAAYTHVDRAESEPDLCWEVNLRGVERLVEACRQAGAALVQISTDYVFDGRKRSAYLESDEPNPLSTYGRSKLEAERVAAELSNHLIVRTAGLFGPAGPASRGSFVETILRLAEGGKPIRVVSDRFASPTYTCDLARAIESLLRAGRPALIMSSMRVPPPGTRWPSKSCDWPAGRPWWRRSSAAIIQVRRRGPDSACWPRGNMIRRRGGFPCRTGGRPWPPTSHPAGGSKRTITSEQARPEPLSIRKALALTLRQPPGHQHAAAPRRQNPLPIGSLRTTTANADCQGGSIHSQGDVVGCAG